MQSENERTRLIAETFKWQKSFGVGLHGPFIDPRGSRGFLSRTVGPSHDGYDWYPIGEGQDVELVRRYAQTLHDSFTGTAKQDPTALRFIGLQLEELAKPKNP